MEKSSMKHLLIYGPNQQSRQKLLLEELSAYSDAGSKSLKAMIFVPTRRKMAELKGRILAHLGRRCWTPQVTTFHDFMSNHYGEVLGERQLLNSYGRLLVIRHLLQEGRFGYFPEASFSYGLSQKIADVLEYLQTSLFEESEDTGEEARRKLVWELTAESPEKAQTVELFDQTYHQFLSAHRLVDENILRCELLRNWQQNRYPIDVEHALVLDEYSFFSDLEQATFHALVPSFQKIILTLAAPEGDWKQSHRGYDSTQSIAEWLTSYEWEEREAPCEMASLPQIIASRLFSVHIAPNLSVGLYERDEPQNDFRLLIAPNRREEVRIIARSIRNALPPLKVGKINSDLRRFVVVFPDLAIYRPLVEEVFSEYFLPVNISRGYPLQQVPIIGLLKKILTCVLTGWKRSDLFDVLSSGWISCRKTELSVSPNVIGINSMNTPEIDIADVARVTGESLPPSFVPEEFDIHRIDRWVRAAVTQQYFQVESWFSKIKLYIEQEYQVEDTESAADYSNALAQAAFDLLAIQQFIEHAKKLTRAESPWQFADALRQFMEQMIKNQWARGQEGKRARGQDTEFNFEFQRGKTVYEAEGCEPCEAISVEQSEQKEDALFTTAYLEFARIVNEMVKTFRALKSRKYSSEDYIEYITRAISAPDATIRGVYAEERGADCCTPSQLLTTSYQEASTNAVQVIAPLETGGLSFEYLFIGGLVEGEYPSRPISNFLITPDESQPLPLAALNKLPQERFLLQQMIGNAQRVMLTYPKIWDGKELTPSPFVEDIRSLFSFPPDDKSNEIAPMNEMEKETIFSEQEVLRKMGEQNTIIGGEHLNLEYANLQTQLSMEEKRENLDSFSDYDGHLEEATSLKISDTYESATFSYSVLQLDNYAQCPMKFFFQNVLNLKGLAEAEAEISPKAKGNLVHSILQKFYDDEQMRKRADIEEARAIMPQIAQREAEQYEEQFADLYGEEEKRMLVSGLTNADEPKGILQAFLEVDFEPTHEMLEGNYRPTHFEYHFGRFRGRGPQGFALRISREMDKSPIRIRGIIDRVDIDAEEGLFVVYDYKTGGHANAKRVEQGISFQLPIYQQAIAASEEGQQPAAGAYYVLKKVKEVGKKGHLGVWDALKDEYKYKKDGSIKKPPSGFYFAEDFELLHEFVIENIKSIDEFIRSGKFNPSIWEAKDALCQWCDYKCICRYNPSRQLNMKSREGHYHPRGFNKSVT